MLKKILIYMSIGIVLTTAPLYYLNNIIFTDSKTVVSANDRLLPELKKVQVKLPSNAKYISLLYNHDYIAYVDSGLLRIEDTKRNTLYRTVNEDSSVLYALPMEDRNIIIYFTYYEDKLSVKTYDMDKGEKTDHKEITIKDFNKIRDVKYSSLTNVIYIDAETYANKTVKDKIYRVDIMKDVTLYDVNKGISGMMLLNGKDTLIYEDNSNNVYIKSRLFKYQNYKKFKLLGVDNNDYVYIAALDNMSNILVVKNGVVESIRQIDDVNYISSINRDNKVYLIYKDHILSLVDNKEIKISPESRVVDINGNSMLYENGNNEIVIERIKL